MREKEIEKMLVNAVKIHGGLALKFATFRKNCICRDESTRTENEEHTDKAKKAIRIIRFFGVLH